jgi:hypothetical protein
MSEQAKFWITTLIMPVVLVIVGFVVNNTLEEKQRSFDKIKLAEEIIDKSFESDNPFKALALSRLIPSLTDDKEFADSIKILVNLFYSEKAKKAALASDEATYNQISDAAAVFNGGGINISENLKKDPITSVAESAKGWEEKGFTDLQKGDLVSAQKNFAEADKAYPGFHSNYEISKLIKSKLDSSNQNPTKAKTWVMNEIRRKYSWKVKPQMIKEK